MLTPTKARYLDLIVTSAMKLAHVEDHTLAEGMQSFIEAAKSTVAKIRAARGVETFPADGTTNENEMSTVTTSQSPPT